MLRKVIQSFILIASLVISLQMYYPGPRSFQDQSVALAKSTPRVNIYVDTSSPSLTSNFELGMTSTDTTIFSPWMGGMHRRLRDADQFSKKNLSFLNVQIMGWGVDDPWPEPWRREPGNWASLDEKLRMTLATGATPVLTLCEAPWWMKGHLNADGSTTLLTGNREFSDMAYESRVLDNKVDDWLHLVRRVAERYMAPPYNVRYFQIWNELKGYYNPGTNNWDINTWGGDPSGKNAKHGYTYMYNKVYDLLRKVASEKGISRWDVKIGGPYVAMDTWPSNNQSNPSDFVKPYGAYDQRSLDALQYWLRHKAGADFLTLSGHNRNRDGPKPDDPFLTSEKFGDVVKWIRGLDEKTYPGASWLPIWWSEWYADPFNHFTRQYDDAVKAFAMIKLLKAGGAIALMWGSEDAWASDDHNRGGPLPWYYSVRAFNKNFGVGTRIYNAKSSSREVEVLASYCHAMLVNKTWYGLPVSVNGKNAWLDPYEVSVIPIPASNC